MNLKLYHRYRMNFSCKWAKWSGIFAGASIFALAVYYFLLRDFAAIGTGEAIFALALPLLLCVAYIVLMRIVKMNSPGAFAILGALLCLVLMFGSFSSGNLLRVVLGCIWYIAAGVILLATAGGFLPGALPASVMFRIAFCVRALFGLSLRGLSNWVHEVSVLSILLALVCLPMTFTPGRMRSEK